MLLYHLQATINTRRAAIEALGITDFVEVPAYFVTFDSVTGNLAAAGPARSMLPDMVNMLNVNGTLIVPDPNPHWAPHPVPLPPPWGWIPPDPFKVEFQNAVGAGTTVKWIDCMEYHYDVGEVHCGTNVRREPRSEIRQWWLVTP